MPKNRDLGPDFEHLAIPFGGDVLITVDGKMAMGGLACIQGLESGEIDDHPIWDAPGTLFPQAPELPESPSTPTEE